MRLRSYAAWLVAVVVGACGGTPPPPPAAPAPEEEEPVPEEPAPVASAAVVDAPERTKPPSTASYEQAVSKPEMLDIDDERVHLTDAQLTGPMRSVVGVCKIPPNARVTVKTAVQFGRAIGVTVGVRFEHPKSTRRPSWAAAKAEAKAAAKIVSCVDHAVRAVVWPPSRRRDSFTTVF